MPRVMDQNRQLIQGLKINIICNFNGARKFKGLLVQHICFADEEIKVPRALSFSQGSRRRLMAELVSKKVFLLIIQVSLFFKY